MMIMNSVPLILRSTSGFCFWEHGVIGAAIVSLNDKFLCRCYVWFDVVVPNYDKEEEEEEKLQEIVCRLRHFLLTLSLSRLLSVASSLYIEPHCTSRRQNRLLFCVMRLFYSSCKACGRRGLPLKILECIHRIFFVFKWSIKCDCLFITNKRQISQRIMYL